ncbi:hypothetical protein U2F26_16795 [Micromonospora sp. 4G57]|uniref:Streptomyces killer toxin-like beta/gamma crystallin domain-containing protein n=1 Tax=Micromonospora sicca TaxID=2202420 RepID=A0ABU5JB71_9ACTN|nr:hypothetical protein [Micromonospora sp. 4G57]MDZ5444380.1 hypothetical protein [Micromonospora sp. 4G57]MDZ5489786.1 hypothetical protein [Micromonospora sp. 4G53]
MTGVALGLAGALAAVTPAVADRQDMSGTVYDAVWSHYSTKRCSTGDPTNGVTFHMTSYPDGDDMSHYASTDNGGGARVGVSGYFNSPDTAWYTMGFGKSTKTCFYWNSQQYEGLNLDGYDTWTGQIDHVVYG